MMSLKPPMQKKPQKLIQVTDKYGNTKQKAVAVIGAKDLDRLKLGSKSDKGSPTLMERIIFFVLFELKTQIEI